MFKLLFILVVFSSVLLSNEKLNNAVATLKNSNVEAKLLAATKVIVDSSDEKAWQKLITHLSNEALMLKKGYQPVCGMGNPSYNMLWPTFFNYFEVIYSSKNKRLLDFLKILGTSPAYLINRDFSDLFAYKLKSFKNKDEEFYQYIKVLSGRSVERSEGNECRLVCTTEL